MSHSIRLHGPWTYYIGTVAAASSQRLTVPGKIELPNRELACVTLVRVFHRPTGLDDSTRVLVFGSGKFGDVARVELNSHSLGESQNGEFRFEVTEVLQSSNQLTIQCLEVSSEVSLDFVGISIEENS